MWLNEVYKYKYNSGNFIIVTLLEGKYFLENEISRIRVTYSWFFDVAIISSEVDT